jgi:hypothetical protein
MVVAAHIWDPAMNDGPSDFTHTDADILTHDVWDDALESDVSDDALESAGGADVCLCWAGSMYYSVPV